MRYPFLAAVTALATAIVTAVPAAAAPSEPVGSDYVWRVTSASTPSVRQTPHPDRQLTPRLRPTGDIKAQRAVEDDFKDECMQRPEARNASGWARNRFEQCFIGSKTVDLLSRRDGSRIAQIEFEYSLLAFAVDGQRRVDYVFDFNEFDTSGGEPLTVTTLTVDFSGCGGPVICSPTPTLRSDLVPTWKTASSRRFDFSITSPNDTGDGTYWITRSLIQMNMSVVTALADVAPWSQAGLASSRVRFDSARGALGQGKFHGAVFSDYAPTAQFHVGAGSDHVEEARHIYDALNNPQRTYPSFANKSVPGRENRPLHRLMNKTLQDKNTASAVKICKDVWGEEYTSGGAKQCDEYPFKTTYEGAATSTGATEQNPTGGNESRWQGSARPIGAKANENAGNVLALFYGQNRVLDENIGTTKQGTPSEPFFVSVVP